MEDKWSSLKLLITGTSGLYGAKLAELAINKGHTVYSMHSQHPAKYGVSIQADITDKTKIRQELNKLQPEVIVHAASMTDVDKCELNKELAWKINVEGTQNIARAAQDNGAFILYISTDYVFDGERGCYKETDQTSPISYYAYTKLNAEKAVQNIAREYCIARPSVIYGAAPAAGKVNFALWLINNLQNKEKANVFTDQWNSPTLNSSLAEMTMEVAERRITGILHLSGATRISRYNFGVTLAKTFDLDSSLLVPTEMKNMSFPAKRPKDSSLDTSKAIQLLNNKPLEIQAALKKFKSEMA
jgi:dTDP-4-dehydrorhamnose reductase